MYIIRSVQGGGDAPYDAFGAVGHRDDYNPLVDDQGKIVPAQEGEPAVPIDVVVCTSRLERIWCLQT